MAPDTKFVLDNNLSHKIAAALAALDLPVCHTTDFMPADTPDEVLIPEIGKRGLILITQDKRIRKHKHERLALQQAGIGAFFYIGQADKSLADMTRMILRDIPNMIAIAAKRSPPYTYGIADKGKIEELK